MSVNPVPPLTLDFIEVEDDFPTARAIVNGETLIEEVCTGLLRLITHQAIEDDKIDFVTPIITKIVSSLSHFSGEELLALILGCSFIFKNDEKKEDPPMALIGLLCSLAPDFFKLTPGPFFTSLYGTLEWCEEVILAENEGANATQLIKIITTHLKTTIVQRGKEGRFAAVENGECVASNVSREERLFHDWYRLCYWLTRCITLDNRDQVTNYIVEWGLVPKYSPIDQCKIISALGVPALFLVQNGARDFRDWCHENPKGHSLVALADILTPFSEPFFSSHSALTECIIENLNALLKNIQEQQTSMLPFDQLLTEIDSMHTTLVQVNKLIGEVKAEQEIQKIHSISQCLSIQSFHTLLWRPGFSWQMLGSPRSSNTELLNDGVTLLQKLDKTLRGEENEDSFYLQCIENFIEELKRVCQGALRLPSDGSRSARVHAKNNLLLVVGSLYVEIKSPEIQQSCLIKIWEFATNSYVLTAAKDEIRALVERSQIFIVDGQKIYYIFSVSDLRSFSK